MTTTHIAATIWITAGAISIYCAIVFGRELARRAAWEAHVALAMNAADWSEPTRADVEAPWLADHGHVEPAPLDHAKVARIRAQIKANHDAECARFRAELEQFGGGAA